MDDPGTLIDIAENEEPPLGAREVVKAVLHPSLVTAFLLHLIAILVLAFLFFPIPDHSHVILMDSEDSQLIDLEPLQEFDIELAESELELEKPLLRDLTWLEPEPLPSTDMNLHPVSSFVVENPLDERRNEELGSIDEVDSGDPESDRRIVAIQQRVKDAGGQEGEVQFSLSWNTETDLDLHVITPYGQRIHYREKVSRCKGKLDVDRNARRTNTTTTPVENVRWKNEAVAGRYSVIVHLFRKRDRLDEIDFELMAKTGLDVDLQSSKISNSNSAVVFRYLYFSPNMTQQAREQKKEGWKRLQEKEEATAAQLLSAIPFGSAHEMANLWEIVDQFPHTDAAVRAWQRIPGSGRK